MNKPLKILTALALTASLTATTFNSAEASTQKVMWGKTELKVGQVGKITVLKDAPLYKIVDSKTISSTRTLKKGEEFRVYSYKNQSGGLYGVGGGMFIQKDSKIKYETPSKSKLKLIADYIPVITVPNKENQDFQYSQREIEWMGNTNTARKKIESVIPEGYPIMASDNSAIVLNGKNVVFSYSYNTDEYVKENSYPFLKVYNNKIGFSSWNEDREDYETYLDIFHATITKLGLQVSRTELGKALTYPTRTGKSGGKVGDAEILDYGGSINLIWNDK